MNLFPFDTTLALCLLDAYGKKVFFSPELKAFWFVQCIKNEPMARQQSCTSLWQRSLPSIAEAHQNGQGIFSDDYVATLIRSKLPLPSLWLVTLVNSTCHHVGVVKMGYGDNKMMIYTSATVGSDSYASPSALVETTSSILSVVSWTPADQVEAGLYNSTSPLEELTLNGNSMDMGMILKLGGTLQGHTTFSYWSKVEEGFHINCLEILAECQACQFFLPDLKGHHVLIRSDNMSLVSYISVVS